MIKEKYIIEAQEIHKDKYDYNLIPSTFKGTDKIPLTCKKHGIFYCIARNHIHGGQTGCPECGKEKVRQALILPFDKFVEKALLKHGDKYVYFEDEYIKATTKTKILCKKCNKIFEQVPTQHLYGNGCPYCNPMPQKLTNESFVNRLKKTHPNLEVLSEYNGIDKPITVRCTIHDYTYTTTPHRLKSGANCQKCYDERRGKSLKKSIEQVLKEFHSVHGDKYQYPHIKEEYKNSKSTLTIICSEHGEFKQTHNKHFIRQQGCPKCNQSHMERDIKTILCSYEEQKKFDWLLNVNQLLLDFYLPDYNIAIECQGEQHFLPRKHFGGQEGLENNVQRDKIKKRLCEEHNIKMLYIIPKKFIKICKNKIFDELYSVDNMLIYEDILKDKNILLEKLK